MALALTAQAVDVNDSYPPHEIKSRRALNLQIVETASSLALADSADLHIVHAWHPIGESALRHSTFTKAPERQVNDYVEQVREKRVENLDDLMREVAANVGQDALDFLRPKMHLVKGRARQEVPTLANRIDADLVVMGTVARTGVPGFIMGNTAEYILNQIDCSVLALKPPSFVSPVTLDA